MIIVLIIAVFIAFFNCGIDVKQKDKKFKEKLNLLTEKAAQIKKIKQ
jgi:hypothetical protein